MLFCFSQTFNRPKNLAGNKALATFPHTQYIRLREKCQGNIIELLGIGGQDLRVIRKSPPGLLPEADEISGLDRL